MLFISKAGHVRPTVYLSHSPRPKLAGFEILRSYRAWHKFGALRYYYLHIHGRSEKLFSSHTGNKKTVNGLFCQHTHPGSYSVQKDQRSCVIGLFYNILLWGEVHFSSVREGAKHRSERKDEETCFGHLWPFPKKLSCEWLRYLFADTLTLTFCNMTAWSSAVFLLFFHRKSFIIFHQAWVNVPVFSVLAHYHTLVITT